MMPSLPLRLPPDNEMLRAIGTVAVQWGYLEYEVDQEIKYLLEMPHNPTKDFGFHLSFEKRARHWRRFARLTFPQMLIADVESISSKANKIKPKRDGIVHGLYGGGNEKINQSIFRFANMISVENISTEEIDKVAADISAIGAEMLTHVATIQAWLDGQHGPLPPQWPRQD